jgi:hypothetical protein
MLAAQMKPRELALFGGYFVVVFSGCTTTNPGRVTYDPKALTTIVTGKETTISPLAGPVRTLFLKAEISPGKTELYLVVLYLSVNGWLSAEEVRDSSGKRFQGFRGKDEAFDVQFGKVTKEIYYIPLERSYLEAHRRSGFEIHLQGSRNVLAAAQPASFVDQFLSTYEATERKLTGKVRVHRLIPAPKPSFNTGSILGKQANAVQ